MIIFKKRRKLEEENALLQEKINQLKSQVRDLGMECDRLRSEYIMLKWKSEGNSCASCARMGTGEWDFQSLIKRKLCPECRSTVRSAMHSAYMQ